MIGVYVVAGIVVLLLTWGIVTVLGKDTRMSERIPFDPNISRESEYFWVDTDPGDDNRFV